MLGVEKLDLGLIGLGEPGVFDGKGGLDESREGSSRSNPVGRRQRSDRKPGEFANSVMDRRSGIMRINHSIGKLSERFGGRRVLNAEYNAIEVCFC